MILYTKPLVVDTAEKMGAPEIADAYFKEDPNAFDLINSFLKDAEYKEVDNETN